MHKGIAWVLAIGALLAFGPVSAHSITGVLCIKDNGKGTVKVRAACKSSEVQVGVFDTVIPQANLSDLSVRLEGTTFMPVSDGGSLAVPFGVGTEVYDTNDTHDENVNPSRIIAPVTGKYYIYGTVNWSPNGVGVRAAHIQVNGSFANYVASSSIPPVTLALPTIQNISTQVDLVAGDYVELVAAQASGGSLSVLGTSFGMAKLP